MVVGYSLGNRNDPEDEIKVLGEDDPSVLTYSLSLPITLSKVCQNECPYCSFRGKGKLTVPYSIIKVAKNARAKGAREALIASGERPDQSPHIRALLDLWGFESYLDYVYTVCELAFLEGLIPVLEIGFLSPEEMRRLQEISAVVKIMLDSTDRNNYKKLHPKSPGKQLDVRLKSLEWAGKMGLPAITGLMVGIGETKTHRKDALKSIAELHSNYGNIHEVLIQNFVPQANTQMEKKNAASDALLLEVFETAKTILPDDIPVTIPVEMISDLTPFLNSGLKDLGRFTFGARPLIRNGSNPIDLESIDQLVQKQGFRMQQRFPIRKEFIKEGLYSKKLGQVFDTYKYKIKKEGQEKLKEAKINSYGS